MQQLILALNTPKFNAALPPLPALHEINLLALWQTLSPAHFLTKLNRFTKIYADALQAAEQRFLIKPDEAYALAVQRRKLVRTNYAGVKELNFNESQDEKWITLAEIETLHALLTYDDQIQELHLRHIRLDDRVPQLRTKYIDCLVSLMTQNCTIVHLDLSDTNFTLADTVRLNQALVNNQVITNVGNSYNDIALTRNPAIDLVQQKLDKEAQQARIMQLTAKFILLLKYFYLEPDLTKLAALLTALDLTQVDATGTSLLTLANRDGFHSLYNYLSLYQQPAKTVDASQIPRQAKGKEKVGETDIALETEQPITSSTAEDINPVGNSPTLAALFANENSTISLKYENLNEVAITYHEFADLIHNYDNQYSADWMNMLVYQCESKLIKVYPTISPALLRNYLTPLQHQTPRYAFIPLNVAYQSTYLNHFISLILDRQQQQLFYLNPLNSTTIDTAVESLKSNLDYSKAIILNTIDFQQREGAEGWLRHCGMYVAEIFKTFSETVALGVEIDAQNIRTILSAIPCGEAANATHIRKQHVNEAFAVLLRYGDKSPDREVSNVLEAGSSNVNTIPLQIPPDQLTIVTQPTTVDVPISKSAQKSKSRTKNQLKDKRKLVKNDLDIDTITNHDSVISMNSTLSDSSKSNKYNITDVKSSLAQAGHTLESILNHARLRKGCFVFSTIVPGGVDALGNGCISLAQALTVVKAGRLTFANTDYEFDWQHWSAWLLTAGAGLATIGYLLLNAKENEAFLLKGKVKFSELNLVNYPIQTLLVLLMAVAEGFITVANFGYVMDEVAIPFSDPLIYWLSLALGLIVGTQFAFMNVNPFAKHLTIKGYMLRHKYDYWQHLHREANLNIPKWRDTLYQGLNWFGRVTLGGFINVLPLLSALGRGALVSAESYALFQYWLSRFVPADEANRLAFGPASTFGLCYTGVI